MLASFVLEFFVKNRQLSIKIPLSGVTYTEAFRFEKGRKNNAGNCIIA
jgi:hypothetical protein